MIDLLRNKINILANLLIVCAIIGFFNEGYNAFKNIGIYSGLIIALLYAAIYKTNNFIIIKNKLSYLFFLYIFYIFISSFFAYTSFSNTILNIINEIKFPLIFLLITLFFKPDIKTILFAFLIAAMFLEIHYFYKSYIIYHNNIRTFRIDRFYSSYFEIIFPFLLAGILYVKNIFYKFLYLLVISIGLIELFFTGARGSWLSILLEIFIFILVIIRKNKKIILPFIFIIFVSFLSLLILYNNTNLIKQKINQGLNSSGRNIIIKDRFPIFIKSDKIILGLGFGIKNYQKFMKDNNAPKRLGKYENKNFIYFHDEPYLLSIFYHHGIIGLSILLIFIFYFFKDAILILKKFQLKLEFLFILAIISNIFIIFFGRGLFEFMHLKYIFLLFILYQLAKENLNETSNNIS